MFTVITRNNCVFCDNAKEALKEAHQYVQEFNIEEERWVLDLIKKAGFKTVPQIYSPTGDYIGGFTELKEYLDK